MAFGGGNMQIAILLSQRMVDRSKPGPLTVDRRKLVARLLDDRGDLMVITGIGSATYDVAACGDHPLNFYIWSGLGCTAIGRPRTCAGAPGSPRRGDHRRRRRADGAGQPRDHRRQAAEESHHRLLDNGHYSASGMQPSAHLAGHRSRRRRRRPASCASRRCPTCLASTSCARCCTRGAARCSFTPASMPTTRSASSRAATARHQAALHAGVGRSRLRSCADGVTHSAFAPENSITLAHSRSPRP